MCMFLEKRDLSWNCKEIRVYLLVMVNHQKHIESTFIVSGRSRLEKMLLSMKIQLLEDQRRTIQMRFMMRILKLLG